MLIRNVKREDKIAVVAIFTALLMSFPVVSAQEEQAYPPREISLLIVDDGVNSHHYLGDPLRGIPETPSVPLYYVSDDEPRKVDVHFASLSPLYAYRGPRELKFYRREPPVEAGEPMPPAVAEVMLPEDARQVVLLFFTVDFKKRHYRIVALDDSPDSFPENNLRIYNLSSGPLLVDLAGDRSRIDPKRMELIPLSTDEPYQRLKIARFDKQSEDWRVEYGRYLPVRDGTRTTLLILPKSGGHEGDIYVTRIQDMLRLRQGNFE